MGAKAKKSLKIKLKKQSARLSISKLKNESSDFLKKDQGEKFIKRKRSLFKIHQQCYTLDMYLMDSTRTKWKTGKSKHYGFLEFENPEVAKVVADELNNYLLFVHNLQIYLISPDLVPPNLWKGLSHRFTPLNWKEITRLKHNKERTAEEYQQMIRAIVKIDAKRRKRIEAAGIDYECPELVGMQPAAKKIKLYEEED